jgi:hypothetical protein
VIQPWLHHSVLEEKIKIQGEIEVAIEVVEVVEVVEEVEVVEVVEVVNSRFLLEVIQPWLHHSVLEEKIKIQGEIEVAIEVVEVVEEVEVVEVVEEVVEEVEVVNSRFLFHHILSPNLSEPEIQEKLFVHPVRE